MKYLAHTRFPRRSLIQERMEKRFSIMSLLLKDIIAPCAEEAERIIHELWLDESQRPEPVRVKTVEIRAVTIKAYHRYYCPECGKQSIYPSHNYCPKCGIKIIWTS